MNKQWLLARTPSEGLPTDDDFNFVESPIPEPGPNQMLTRTIYLSLDPYQWGRRRSGLEQPGEVCHGRTASQVVKKQHCRLPRRGLCLQHQWLARIRPERRRHLGFWLHVSAQNRSG